MHPKLAVAAMAFALPMALAAPAMALDWGIGAELGGSLFLPTEDPEGDDAGIATFSWPTIGAGFHQVGGIRASFAGADPRHELWLGTSYASMTTEGRSINWFLAGGNYQYNFAPEARVGPYLTGGVGIISRSGSGASGVGAVFGAGAGLARRVTDGAGRLRAELRYDRQTDATSGDLEVVRGGGVLALKLGFDLWVR